MEVSDLKNYGLGLSECFSGLPRKVKSRSRKAGFRVIFRNLGVLDTLRFAWLYWREKKRLSKLDLSPVRQKGMTDDKFIAMQVEFAAIFLAASKILGKKKAVELLFDMSAAASPIILEAVFPTREDLMSFSDPFAAFSEYQLAAISGARSAACHFIEVVENTVDVFQMDVTYCVWNELLTLLGAQEASSACCHGDDVFLPGFLRPLGISYERTSTIARRADRCDFRFERVQMPPE